MTDESLISIDVLNSWLEQGRLDLAISHLDVAEKPEDLHLNEKLLEGISDIEGAELERLLGYLRALGHRGDPYLPGVLAVAVESVESGERAREFLQRLRELPPGEDDLRRRLSGTLEPGQAGDLLAEACGTEEQRSAAPELQKLLTRDMPEELQMLFGMVLNGLSERLVGGKQSAAAFLLGELAGRATLDEDGLREWGDGPMTSVKPLLRLLYVVRRHRLEGMADDVRRWGWRWYREHGRADFTDSKLGRAFLATLSNLEQDNTRFAADRWRVGFWCEWSGWGFEAFFNSYIQSRRIYAKESWDGLVQVLESENADDVLAGVAAAIQHPPYLRKCRELLGKQATALRAAERGPDDNEALARWNTFALALLEDADAVQEVRRSLEAGGDTWFAERLLQWSSAHPLPDSLIRGLSAEALDHLLESAWDRGNFDVVANMGLTIRDPYTVLRGLASSVERVRTRCRSSLQGWAQSCADLDTVRTVLIQGFTKMPELSRYEKVITGRADDDRAPPIAEAMVLLELLLESRPSWTASLIVEELVPRLDSLLSNGGATAEDAIVALLTATSRVREDQQTALSSIRSCGAALGLLLTPEHPLDVQQRARRLQKHCTQLTGERFGDYASN